MTECTDPRCSIHGGVKVRGNVFTGVVKSAKASKTVVIEKESVIKVPKYERYKKIRSRIAAHNPDCIKAEEGDIVTIGETRKLSKRKSFVVLKKEGKAKIKVKGKAIVEKVKEAKKDESH